MRLTDAEFQALHGKLCRFFEWNRCQSPEDLSQEAILRGLKRMAEGQENYAENPQSYFFGIARNIVREERKKPQMQSTGEEDCPDRIDQLGALQWRILLRECLEQLDTRDRDLLVGYILDGAGKGRSRVWNHTKCTPHPCVANSAVRSVNLSAARQIPASRVKQTLDYCHRWSGGRTLAT